MIDIIRKTLLKRKQVKQPYGKVILGVTISLDGFAEDCNGSVGALYPHLEIYDNTGVMLDAIQNTGAIVMAWKEFAMAEDPDWFAGNYEFQVPIFVFTDKVPKKHPKETDRLTFTFVTDGIESDNCDILIACRCFCLPNSLYLVGWTI